MIFRAIPLFCRGGTVNATSLLQRCARCGICFVSSAAALLFQVWQREARGGDGCGVVCKGSTGGNRIEGGGGGGGSITGSIFIPPSPPPLSEQSGVYDPTIPPTRFRLIFVENHLNNNTIDRLTQTARSPEDRAEENHCIRL